MVITVFTFGRSLIVLDVPGWATGYDDGWWVSGLGFGGCTWC